MLGKRVLTVLWSLPLVIVAVWFAEPLPWFTVAVSAAGILAALEFYRMTGVLKYLPLAICGILLILLFILYPHFQPWTDISLVSLLVAADVILPLIILIFLPKQEGLRQGVFHTWAWTLSGVLYIGGLLSFYIALRLIPDVPGFPETGRNLVFLALFASFASDTTAYFVGKAIGRHKLAPSISPGKTWEGAAGGIVGAGIISLLFVFHTPFQLPMVGALTILLAVLVSVFGQLGDLAESMLKRGTGVKDSGTIMPGHGGILDRLDSLFFAGVLVYWFYTLVAL
jgi:phosphatidate cytidylyltransferase